MELLASTPFEHEITARGLPTDEVGSTKHLPPTLNLQYYPLTTDCAFQLYLGIGVNYTVFFEEDTSRALADMSLDDSFGLSLQVGADYSINDNWMVNAAVWRLDLGTTAEIDSDAG